MANKLELNDSTSILNRIMHKKKIEKNHRERPFDELLDPEERENLDHEIDKIIDTAAKKTNHEELLKDKPRHDYVKKVFIDNYLKIKENADSGQLTPLELANIALLSVLSAYVPGAQRIVIQAGSRITNEFAAPNFNLYGSDNLSVIAESKRINWTNGDALGLEAQATIELLERGDIVEELTAEFMQEGFLKEQEKKRSSSSADSTSPFGTPKLIPPVRHIVDDGEGD